MPKNNRDHHPKDLVLDHYHCTLFLPLIGIEKYFQPKGEPFYYSSPKLAEAEAQAYRYFSPALRNILFDLGENNSDKSEQAVKEWRLTNNEIESWELHLGKEEEKNDPTKYQRSKIVSVRLLQYFNGIYTLAVRVEPLALRKLNALEVCNKKLRAPASFKRIELRPWEDFKSLLKNTKDYFYNNNLNNLAKLIKKDPDNKEHLQQLAMENWLRFTRHIRLLYPTFPQQNEESKIAPIHLIRQGKEIVTAFKDKIEKIQIYKKPGQDFSPVMSEILKAFAKQPENVQGMLENYEDLYDDRLFVSVAYGIAGEKLPEESLKRINTLVSFVDRQEADGFEAMGGYAYTPKIIQEKTKKNAFSLWEGLGGYFSYTDFSNSYLYNGWAFRDHIAPEHIPHIYDRMLVQALFYQASLRHYDKQICNETNKLLEQDDIKAIKQQRKAFVRFTNQYWFHSVTTQMQGQDIFRLQQKALGLQQHYAVLKDELERTDEYLQTIREIKIAKITGNISRYGLLLAFAAIYYTVLSIVSSAVKTNTSSLWLKANSWFELIHLKGTPLFNDETYGLVIMLGLFPALFVMLFLLFNKDHD